MTMSPEILQIVRLAWFPALGIMLSAFRDALGLTRSRPDRRYVRTATRARVVLGVIEGVLVIAAVAATVSLRAADSVAALITGPARDSAGATAYLAILGMILAFAGAVLASVAKRALGVLFTANLGVKEDHTLVTTGPYALVRHPIYLGILLFTLGTGLGFDRGSVALLAVALTPCFLVQARIEDRIFAAHFGAEHAAYCARVPAVLPWPRPR
jgi:protein-S-isoprenylcysteine O-methyltransferase Ste14